RMYLPSRCSYSRAREVGVLPIATTSSTSGIETRPSGRTGTVTVSSGLRHTKIFRLSPGPMRYSADGNEEAGGAGGSSGAPPHPVSKMEPIGLHVAHTRLKSAIKKQGRSWCSPGLTRQPLPELRLLVAANPKHSSDCLILKRLHCKRMNKPTDIPNLLSIGDGF